jgi:hypothetical protein
VDDGKLVSFKRGVHCAGGDTKNRSKECRIDLVVDRISTATVRVNELPLWFAATANCATRTARRACPCRCIGGGLRDED